MIERLGTKGDPLDPTDRIEEIRARLDAATPGEAWNVPNVDYTDADCDLIVNAYADIAWLLDMVVRERARAARLQKRWAESEPWKRFRG